MTFLVYTLAGLLAGLAGFVFMMRLGSASPTAGDPLLLEIIGAVVLGGTALSGGEGGVVRTFTGALLVAMIIKSLELMGAAFWDQMIVIGLLIALGSAMGAWLSRRRTSESRRTAQKLERGGQSRCPNGRRVCRDARVRKGTPPPVRDTTSSTFQHRFIFHFTRGLPPAGIADNTGGTSWILLVSGVPHAVQNFLLDSTSLPHCSHRRRTTCDLFGCRGFSGTGCLSSEPH